MDQQNVGLMHLLALSIVWYSEQNSAFRKLALFPFSGEKVGLLERVNRTHWTMFQVSLLHLLT
jgi:hypothetical protein